MEKMEKGSNKKVMLVIDESECSHYALLWVLDNLQELITGSPLVIFAAQPVPKCQNTLATHLGFILINSEGCSKTLFSIIQQQNKKIALGLLEKAKNICTSKGVKVETITESGDPKELICNAVLKYKIDLLILGNPTVCPLIRACPWNLSNYCVNNAKCSVLVVNKSE